MDAAQPRAVRQHVDVDAAQCRTARLHLRIAVPILVFMLVGSTVSTAASFKSIGTGYCEDAEAKKPTRYQKDKVAAEDCRDQCVDDNACTHYSATNDGTGGLARRCSLIATPQSRRPCAQCSPPQLRPRRCCAAR